VRTFADAQCPQIGRKACLLRESRPFDQFADIERQQRCARNGSVGWPVLARMSRLEIAVKASLIFTIFGGSALMLGLAIIRFSQH